jgi:hypothetical protein
MIMEILDDDYEPDENKTVLLPEDPKEFILMVLDRIEELKEDDAAPWEYEVTIEVLHSYTGAWLLNEDIKKKNNTSKELN